MKIPCLLIGGSDQRPAHVPESLTAQDMLCGYKGALRLPSGRSLAAELVERVRATGRFDDPLLVGPRAVYESAVDCEIVDAEGPLAVTLSRVVEVVQTRYEACPAVAVTTCDILPTTADFVALLAEEFDEHQSSHFWWQWIAAEPADLGTSGWKPRYAIRATSDRPPQCVYPGHLVLFRPPAVRLDLLVRILSLAYRYRNRPLSTRVWPMLGWGMWSMLQADAHNLLRGQLPVLTVSIPWHLLHAYRELRRQELSIPRLEQYFARVLLHRRYRVGPRPVVVAMTRLLAFAQDIDTRGEWDAACAQVMDGR